MNARAQRFQAIHAATRNALWAWLVGMVRDAGDRDEVYQETWLRLLRRLDREPPTSPRAYVIRIARRVLSERRRSSRHRSGLDGDAVVAKPPADGLRERLAAALIALPESRREVFLLRHHAGLSYEEIARTLDLSSGTVASRLHVAVRELRTHLDRLAGQESSP
ncbi:MAG: RNA polymerase subunit sigma [Planctomycetes bacterium]|nr:RNA polymerase subunit sigma [Planctomycetota bacterium]